MTFSNYLYLRILLGCIVVWIAIMNKCCPWQFEYMCHLCSNNCICLLLHFSNFGNDKLVHSLLSLLATVAHGFHSQITHFVVLMYSVTTLMRTLEEGRQMFTSHLSKLHTHLIVRSLVHNGWRTRNNVIARTLNLVIYRVAKKGNPTRRRRLRENNDACVLKTTRSVTAS